MRNSNPNPSNHENKIDETQGSDEEVAIVERSSSSGLLLSLSSSTDDQVANTSKLIMSVYDRVAHPVDGAKVSDITEYLRNKYGDLWKLSTLTGQVSFAHLPSQHSIRKCLHVHY